MAKYLLARAPGPRPSGSGGKRNYVPAHVLIAEQALGRPISRPIHVHHVNYNKWDNSPGNLVVCPDAAYHRLLHQRTDAYNACGNANARKCPYCMEYDAPENMVLSARARGTTSERLCHSECRKKHFREYRALHPRGKGTPRSITHEPPRIAVTGA